MAEALESRHITVMFAVSDFYRHHTKYWAWSLGLLLLWMPPVLAQPLVNPLEPQQIRSADSGLRELSRSSVIYLGETHENSADQQAALELLQQLHRLRPQMAIALEMFQRPAQPLLDQYLRGQLSEAELRRQSQFDQRWGYPWENYVPLLRYAKAHQIPVIALNTPTEITRKVARQGLAGLTEADMQWVPPANELRTDNAAYRQMIREIYDVAHQGHGNSDRFENFFLAQVLWDETMAQGVADFVRANPDHLVMVLSGQGHLLYSYGIPSRVARRLGTHFSQKTILLNPPSDLPVRGSAGDRVADFYWRNSTR